MIITETSEIPSKDTGKYAWSELRRFHNINYVYGLHRQLLKVPDEFKHFAMKQAEQIKFCLHQAREYATAADTVSLATKPLLLYYSCMSLALAEVLFKQGGHSSLDKAREVHNHHGLILRIDERIVRQNDDLVTVASAIAAGPMVRGGTHRTGTFELWHSSARSLPGVGQHTDSHEWGAHTKKNQAIIKPLDERLPLIKESGLTLLHCMSRVPGMGDIMKSYGHTEEFIRGKIETVYISATKNFMIDLLFHPTSQINLDNLVEKFAFRMPNVDKFSYRSFGGGGHLRLEANGHSFDSSRTPSCCNTSVQELLFWTDDSPQNEFCYIYLTLYILGNFARYYPDLWMKAVEQNHPIATASERFIEIAEARMPLCILSEMSRVYYLPKE